MQISVYDMKCLIADACAVAYSDRGNTFEYTKPDTLGEIIAVRVINRLKEFEHNTPILHKIFTLPTGKIGKRDFEMTDKQVHHVESLQIKLVCHNSAEYQHKKRGMKI